MKINVLGEHDIEVIFEEEEAENYAHTGSCDNDCKDGLEEFREEWNKVSDEFARECLKTTGIEHEEINKMDSDTLKIYLLWMAAGNIIDKEEGDSEPLVTYLSSY